MKRIDKKIIIELYGSDWQRGAIDKLIDRHNKVVDYTEVLQKQIDELRHKILTKK